MSLISSFAKIIEESRKEYEQMQPSEFIRSEVLRDFSCADNFFAFGDNAGFMKYLLDECDMRGKIKLIYIDPPFFSKANYEATLHVAAEAATAEGDAAAAAVGTASIASAEGNSDAASAVSAAPAKSRKVKHLAYEDVWEQGMEQYLKMLCTRLLFMRDLLADDGTIWVHLDWHSVHYAKILLDEIFSDKNFINEIIWQYKSGGSSKRHFARKHDNILVYGKTKKYYLKLPKEKSYNRGLKPYHFKGVEEFCDEIGWYTMVNMKDVWKIDMVGRTSGERTGYATQKPEALLCRIIEAASCEGDLVADFFCGSGTLAAAASKLGRKWICSDSGAVAIATCLKRFVGEEMKFDFIMQPDRQGEIEIAASTSDEKNLQMTLFPEKKSYTIEI